MARTGSILIRECYPSRLSNAFADLLGATAVCRLLIMSESVCGRSRIATLMEEQK